MFTVNDEGLEMKDFFICMLEIKRRKELEGLLLSDELLSSYLSYCLGFLVFRLQEGSFNRLPIAVI